MPVGGAWVPSASDQPGVWQAGWPPTGFAVSFPIVGGKGASQWQLWGLSLPPLPQSDSFHKCSRAVKWLLSPLMASGFVRLSQWAFINAILPAWDGKPCPGLARKGREQEVASSLLTPWRMNSFVVQAQRLACSDSGPWTEKGTKSSRACHFSHF